MLSNSELKLSISPKLADLTDALKDQVKVLVICLTQSWGGLEQVVAEDVIDLAKTGVRVRLLCLRGSPLSEHVPETSGVEIERIDEAPRENFDFGFRSVIRYQIGEGYNLIHCHQPQFLGSLAPWVFSHQDVVLILSNHFMVSETRLGPVDRLFLNRLDALVVNSETLKENVLQSYAVRRKAVRVIHLGLDYQVFDPDRVEVKKQRAIWGADDDTIVIGMVGRVDPHKGQATFIKAAAGLVVRSQTADKFKFVIVGEETRGVDSGYLEELKKMVADFHLENHIHFAGFQENIPEVMSAFDLFVMPSKQESFGLVAIEAMAMECPILISKGGSAHEIVGPEEFGLLIRPEDAFDLQRQLRSLLNDPDRRMRMGKKARAHAMQSYDKNVRLYRVLELYERCLRRRQLRKSL